MRIAGKNQMLEDLQKAAAAIEVNKSASDHMMQNIRKVLGILDEATPEEPPSQPDGKPRDRRPKKKKKQTDPFYVKLMKQRRRR